MHKKRERIEHNGTQKWTLCCCHLLLRAHLCSCCSVSHMSLCSYTCAWLPHHTCLTSASSAVPCSQCLYSSTSSPFLTVVPSLFVGLSFLVPSCSLWSWFVPWCLQVCPRFFYDFGGFYNIYIYIYIYIYISSRCSHVVFFFSNFLPLKWHFIAKST